jgi:hypothetical protein
MRALASLRRIEFVALCDFDPSRVPASELHTLTKGGLITYRSPPPQPDDGRGRCQAAELSIYEVLGFPITPRQQVGPAKSGRLFCESG